MNDVLDILLSKFEALPDALEREGEKIMDKPDVQDFILDMNKATMYAGRRSDGTEIDPAYARTTVDMKRQKGQPADRVTLRDTGAFYGGLRVRNKRGSSEIEGTDPKTRDIQAKYDEGQSSVLGLDQAGLNETKDYIRPEFQEFAHNYFTQ